ncbi:MAG TPA: hypothetical protein VIV60_03645, partial [Polyangiaceae bacterium]
MNEEQKTPTNPEGEAEPQAVDDKSKPPHPIGEAINCLVHRARDIKAAAMQYMPKAQKARSEQAEKYVARIRENVPLLESSDRHVQVIAQNEVQRTIAHLNRLRRSDVPLVIAQGLFLSLFSAFDAFTGNLLRGLYQRKPVLYDALNKTITFSDVLTATSLDELKQQVLDDEIDSFRRKSYVEQFASLAQRFEVQLIRFDNWPRFVECSQRRNLITHCDSVVTEQYLKVCKEAGYPVSDLPALGTHVSLGPEYFLPSCELVIEVGIKLGQTLWRKTLPDELELAEHSLADALYAALDLGNWPRAEMIGAYAFGLRQRSSELDRRICIINYAQALKRSGKGDQARKVLDDVDWSAAAR